MKLMGIPEVGLSPGPIPKNLTAEKLNQRAGLSGENAPLRFQDSPNLLSAEAYHRALANGIVPVSQHDGHDIRGHVIGFVLLARTQAWSKLQTILRECLKIEDAKGRAARDAKEMREKIGNIIEGVTSFLTLAEGRNDSQAVERNLKLAANIADAEFKELEKIEDFDRGGDYATDSSTGRLVPMEKGADGRWRVRQK